ncbi:type I-C CRISPR-associated protein Cas8c/Csd1 [Flintibacter faecis]|uniref:Type I-C CRISPR-associated protein Cas8c/Csd1 n=1 Tax=Flintibacter faecis TaxID=2763047 RepID=A0A8J6J4U5_9FIRM|nr:type I-C CRISPR-associated protein Cas8c/Csd1 [Flintibacter faecis]MBC5717206.1 type I-C CRISPR-associated protein Cas8c/Csd1 [Flintibacter faecis]
MILQALTQYYEDLLARGEIAAPGWAPAKISYALCLDEDGQLTQVVPTMEEVPKGKKTVSQPLVFPLPAAEKRTVGIVSNFLWDNSSYLLGVDQKGKPARSRECFSTAAARHHAVLDGVDSPAARAILRFFDSWQPENAAQCPALEGKLEEVTSGGNLLFRVDGRYAQEDAAIREAWQRRQSDRDKDAVEMQCLVTGREDEIAKVHPAIKGVRDAQSSGAALVSFNAPAFCSYGHEQNFNAPVGKYAAFAYTAALNHLLADKDQVQQIGDTTVVCWAEGADPVCQSLAVAAIFGGEAPGGLTDNALRATLWHLAHGEPCDELAVDPNRTFYILGLAPNAARLSVRFFLRDSFGALMRNVNDHYERLEIVGGRYEMLPLWALLRETVNLNSRDKMPSPAMAGATARAVFSGGRYPASLLEGVMLRIRAERNITWGRAAILKAYYLKNPHEDCPKEVLTVSLNEESTNPAYTLGRLFRVMEEIQLASTGWNVNRSIKDSYFNSAASTPLSVFGKLFALSNYHLKKLMRDKPGLGKKLGDLESELAAKLTSPPPARSTQEEVVCFYLGYYHQCNHKKEEEKNV